MSPPPVNIKATPKYNKKTKAFLREAKLTPSAFHPRGTSVFCFQTFLSNLLSLRYGIKLDRNAMSAVSKTYKGMKAYRFTHVALSEEAYLLLLSHKECMVRHPFTFMKKMVHNKFMTYQGFPWKLDQTLEGSIMQFHYTPFVIKDGVFDTHTLHQNFE
jgi:hypothetical protein